ncbi:MAG: NADP-dependent malic enzyme [Planctomycetota bacterium]|nr:NADP-dependent malic enzyme [Planctomycetota bacterium]
MSDPKSSLEVETLAYHESPRPGKLAVIPSKPLVTQHDLSLAYTPGVAIPCLKIEADPEDAYRYTNRGNLVAVITNGSAVLGLGAIGALAGKPVMEGKAVLFKKFAGIDVFDIEVDADDKEAFIDTVRRIAPTFGGINLEDIKAPECFEIEQRLKADLDVPVFHDDQHGTAIISAAALLNACEIADKRIEDLRVVVSGAGAAGIACIDMFVEMGVDRAKVVFCDSRGVVYKGRQDGMNASKEAIAVETDLRTLEDAMKGADLFLGVSGPGLVTQDMVRSMAERPIVFAMANPDPEITYPDAIAARDDVIMATGRSDYPNQVNNVLCFPFMFRGALDVRSTAITDGMKIACARALAELAKQDVPDTVIEAYGGGDLKYGPEYLIPKPFDQRVLLWVAPAVAQAAVNDGVAKVAEFDVEAYRLSLEQYLGGSHQVMAAVEQHAKRLDAKVAIAEGEEPRAIRVAAQLEEQGLATPLLVGDETRVRAAAERAGVDISRLEIVDPLKDERGEEFAARFYELRNTRGVNTRDAAHLVKNPRRYAMLLLDQGYVDCTVTGVNRGYPLGVRDSFEIIGTRRGGRAVAIHLMVLKGRVLFLADTSLNTEPDVRELADIAISTADLARNFDYEPRVAMLSFSNFGSVEHPQAERVAEAVRLVRSERPDIVIDGEMHADIALDRSIGNRLHPHSLIDGDANILIFPDLASGNIGYKLLEHLANAEAIGPILTGMRKPVVVSYQAASVQTVVNLTAIALARVARRRELATG